MVLAGAGRIAIAVFMDGGSGYSSSASEGSVGEGGDSSSLDSDDDKDPKKGSDDKGKALPDSEQGAKSIKV